MLQSVIDKEMANLNLKSIQSRTSQLRDVIIKTPMINLHSPYLNKELSAKNIFLKLECFQHTGTFKARGAISVSSSISLENQKKGFTAASAGNHAIAAAWAARKMGTSAKVVMRSTANPYRIARVKEEMAEISLFTSKSPLLTGVLSDFIFFIKPFFLNSRDKSPAAKK